MAAVSRRRLCERVAEHPVAVPFVRGGDPPYVMAQLGHTDPAFTLRLYAHAMRRDARDNGP